MEYVRISLFVGSVLLSNHALAQCQSSDVDWFQDHYGVEINEGVEFAREIQTVFANKDVEALRGLIAKDDFFGPRMHFLEQAGIANIFSEEWIDDLISEEPSCLPMNDTIFMLSEGKVWYRHDDKTGWSIIALSGTVEESFPDTPIAWEYEGKVIAPSCLTAPYRTGGNYNEIARYYGNIDPLAFRTFPGVFYGNQINSFEEIESSSCPYIDGCNTLRIGSPLEECSTKSAYLEDGYVLEEDSMDIVGYEAYYEIIRGVSTEFAESLAPNWEAKAIQAYLVERSGGVRAGGRYDRSFGIYGLFDIDGGQVIVPLSHYKNKNEALDYIDAYMEKSK